MRRVVPPRAFAAAVAAALALGLMAGCDQEPETPPEPPAQPPTEPRAALEPASFAALPGWAEDGQAEALGAFLRSCERLGRLPADKPMLADGPWAGRVGDWLPLCEAAASVPPTAGTARGFFEEGFRPWRLTDAGRDEGLFTGYYEPWLEGAEAPDERFRFPLYRRPPDMVSVDLGRFAPDLAGRKITGRVEDGRLVPYPERAEIVGGALKDRGLELVWVDDPIAAFFVQVQGSGQVRLPGGEALRVGYDGQNGQPYRAIGKDLVEMGALPKDGVSLQSIRDWLRANPDRADEVMNKNRSFVFFRPLPHLADAPGPPGAQEAPLTPGRSLAVDRRFVPLGAPLWLDVAAPHPEDPRPLRRLVVAQDTGGAIKGPVRGDLFWGAGPEAEFAAGHMQSRGRYYILLPRSLTPVS